jgi:gas vesicle protein
MTQNTQTNGSASYFVTGFLVGGIAAAVTTLLIAPQSGKKTREQLLQTGIDLGNEAITDATAVVEEVRKQGKKLATDVQEKVGDLRKRGQEIIDEQRGHLAAAIAGENEKGSKQ